MMKNKEKIIEQIKINILKSIITSREFLEIKTTYIFNETKSYKFIFGNYKIIVTIYLKNEYVGVYPDIKKNKIYVLRVDVDNYNFFKTINLIFDFDYNEFIELLYKNLPTSFYDFSYLQPYQYSLEDIYGKLVY